MNAPADHRAEALAALKFIQGADNPVAEISSASEATAHALLAVEARLGDLVEQQRLANVITAFVGIEEEGHPLEMGCVDIHAAIVYLHSHIRDIVNPGTEAP